MHGASHAHTGCDGIWDVMSSQEAVDIVRKELVRNSRTVTDAALLLSDRALAMGSTDNITCVIVAF